ncbi:MAG: hypothetical protein ABF313_20165, partial [Marivita sp.]
VDEVKNAELKTTRSASEQEKKDMEIAVKVAAGTKSNCVVYVKDSVVVKLKSPTILWEDDESRPEADYEEGTSGAPALEDLKRVLQRSQADDGIPPVRAAE